MTKTFTGVVPPVLTPFIAADNPEDLTSLPTIDHEALRKQCRRLIDAGVHALFALGSSAEAVFLTREQRREVIESVVAEANGEVPVIAGVIDTATPRVLQLVADAVEAGADGLVATAPFYVRTHPKEIAEHFRRIHAAAPQLPLFAYNIPVSVHVPLAVDTLMELAADGVIAGIKDSGGVDGYTRAVVEARNERGLDDFTVLTGSEMTVDLAYLAGVDGVVPGLGNVDPVSYVELHNLLVQRDFEAAAKLQTKINKLFRIATIGDPARMGGSSAGLGGFKAALVHLGVFPAGVMAPPHQPLNEKELALIAQIVDEAQVREP